MDRAIVNGIEIEYQIVGSGEPVVLLHGGLLADENRPLLDEPALTGRFQVIHYHRRGFGGSGRTTPGPRGQVSIEDQAADCLALIDHLGTGPAHLVGHSLGGAIALAAALARPATVRSLALLEPALMGQIAKVRARQDPSVTGSQEDFRRAFAEVLAIARTGDKRAALLAFLQSRAGEAFRGVLDFLISTGELDRAVADADTFLQVEMPAAFAWEFTPEAAARITQPVLSVLGTRSPERAQLVHRVLTEWIPGTRRLLLDNAEHALPLMDPPGLAAGLVDFLAGVTVEPATAARGVTVEPAAAPAGR